MGGGGSLTRSGRLSISPQAYWAGCGVEREADGSYARRSDGGARLTSGGSTDFACIDFRSAARRKGRAKGGKQAPAAIPPKGAPKERASTQPGWYEPYGVKE